MRKMLGALLSLTLLFGGLAAGEQVALAATAKAGAKCTKLNAKIVIPSGATLQCKKKGSKRVWVQIKAAPKPTASPTPTATATPTATPTPTSSPSPTGEVPPNTIPLYSGGPGASGTSTESPSIPLPSGSPTGAGYNVRLWIYDPESPTRPLGSNGIFVKSSTFDWRWESLSVGGYLLANWDPGVYSLDTVEPNNNPKYQRRGYTLTVAENGTVSVEGLSSNVAGFFTLTITIKQVTSTTFTPTTACQLRYQVEGDTSLSSAFPRATGRLPNSGVVRALIVPVDFPDVPGVGEPASVFFSMADGTDKFFAKQSGGRVDFDFKIVKDWQRQSFVSTKYNLGKWSGGDSSGYYRAVMRSADPVVDYSQFDVVYFLSPTTIPWSSISYGPAFPMLVQTGDGQISSGTFSGADAYQASGVKGAQWKWMSHETGHLFGLHDLYTDGVPATFGFWELMSNNWSNQFIEFTSWNRYISGWLTDSQVNCLTTDKLTVDGTSVLLDPLARDNDKLKAVAVPLSKTKILVVESRRAEGMDNSSAQQSAGTLVYTVDVTVRSIKGGWHVIAPARSVDGQNFTDAALRVGESVEVDGVKIKVVSQTADGDTVLVSR